MAKSSQRKARRHRNASEPTDNANVVGIVLTVLLIATAIVAGAFFSDDPRTAGLCRILLGLGAILIVVAGGVVAYSLWTDRKEDHRLREANLSPQEVPATAGTDESEMKEPEDLTNLSPGTTAPRTGTYRCGFCGAAEFFAKAVGSLTKGGGMPELKQKGTTKFFRKGATLTKCAKCGPSTGWDLVGESGSD